MEVRYNVFDFVLVDFDGVHVLDVVSDSVEINHLFACKFVSVCVHVFTCMCTCVFACFCLRI